MMYSSEACRRGGNNALWSGAFIAVKRNHALGGTKIVITLRTPWILISKQGSTNLFYI